MPFDCHHFESKSVLYVSHNAQEAVYRAVCGAVQVSNDTPACLTQTIFLVFNHTYDTGCKLLLVQEV